ncbi:MAG: hypothetical protein WC726_01020 [Parcubacteria group bacterium]|jgi:hypothetical protein
MQKRILLIASAIAILALFIAGIYYIAIFLPQKQKASVDLVKSEMEEKIEKEKTEREKIEQAMQQLEIEKQQKLEEDQVAQQLEEEKQQQLTEEANRKASVKTQQQAIASSALQKCLDAAEADYKKRLKGITGAGADSGSTAMAVLILQKQRDEALEKCKK